MKKDVLRILLIELFLFIFILFNTFVLKLNNYYILLVIGISAILLYINVGKKKNKFLNQKEVNILMLILAVVYLILFYLMGIYFGFYHSIIKLSVKNLFIYVLPLTLICFITEVLRSYFLSRNNKILYVIGTITLVLLDISCYNNIGINYNLSSMLNFLGYNVLTTLALNLLYNYICRNYGFKSNLPFKMIINIYPYVIPVIPNVYIFIRIFLRIISCFIIYSVLNALYKQKENEYYKETSKEKVLMLVSTIFLAIFCVLISCKFKYCMLVIGSESMTGTINKGDGIIFEKYENQELKIGDIIVFQMDDKVIIHRIINILNDGKETKYITKGDANQVADENYVKNELILGIEKIRIPYIGIPSVWLNECIG